MFFYKINVKINRTTIYSISDNSRHNSYFNASVIMHIYMYIYNTYIVHYFSTLSVAFMLKI